jgi:hypothetical protein
MTARRLYVTVASGTWHILTEPYIRERTLCGRHPPDSRAPWPHRTADMGRVSEDDVCRVCLRVEQRRRNGGGTRIG